MLELLDVPRRAAAPLNLQHCSRLYKLLQCFHMCNTAAGCAVPCAQLLLQQACLHVVVIAGCVHASNGTCMAYTAGQHTTDTQQRQRPAPGLHLHHQLLYQQLWQQLLAAS